MAKTNNSKDKWINIDAHIFVPKSKYKEINESLESDAKSLNWSYKVKQLENTEIIISPKDGKVSPEQLVLDNEIFSNMMFSLIKNFKRDGILFACFRMQYDVRKWKKLKQGHPKIEHIAFRENLIRRLKDRYEEVNTYADIIDINKIGIISDMTCYNIFNLKNLTIFTQKGNKDPNTKLFTVNLLQNR